jgi:hypothetical protein
MHDLMIQYVYVYLLLVYSRIIHRTKILIFKIGIRHISIWHVVCLLSVCDYTLYSKHVYGIEQKVLCFNIGICTVQYSNLYFIFIAYYEIKKLYTFNYE